jgi:hypothetical protein
MIAYTISVILFTLIIASGIFFWVVSMFTGKVEKPILSLIGYVFWPISLVFIWIYAYFYNKYQKGRKDI